MSLFMLVYYISPLPHFLTNVILGGVHSSALLHSAPIDPLVPLDSSLPEFESDSISKYFVSSDALFFSPSKSMPSCSQHCQDILAPGL